MYCNCRVTSHTLLLVMLYYEWNIVKLKLCIPIFDSYGVFTHNFRKFFPEPSARQSLLVLSLWDLTLIMNVTLMREHLEHHLSHVTLVGRSLILEHQEPSIELWKEWHAAWNGNSC